MPLRYVQEKSEKCDEKEYASASNKEHR